ncbi:MAG: hypothetical protein ACETWK_13195 [Candidatus Aminicenantaceae bacterium]
MKKEVLLSGLLGGIVIFVWQIISTGPLPVSGDLPKPIPNDKEIHSMLKERITEPGIYFLPDHSDKNQDLYPDYENEPLFSIIYGGRTPNTFMGQLLFELFCIFAAPIIAAWMLSVSSERILAKYSRRVLFVTVLGLFLAVFGDVFSEKPMDKVLLSSINSLITWALAGLVIAWLIKPKKE